MNFFYEEHSMRSQNWKDQAIPEMNLQSNQPNNEGNTVMQVQSNSPTGTDEQELAGVRLSDASPLNSGEWVLSSLIMSTQDLKLAADPLRIVYQDRTIDSDGNLSLNFNTQL
jgi:hypothetical protein